MKFEYEGVFFIGWVIRLVIFQQVSDYKFKVRHLFIIPILFTLVEYFFYDIVFWGEFFFLPLIVLFIKTKIFFIPLKPSPSLNRLIIRKGGKQAGNCSIQGKLPEEDMIKKSYTLKKRKGERNYGM